MIINMLGGEEGRNGRSEVKKVKKETEVKSYHNIIVEIV